MEKKATKDRLRTIVATPSGPREIYGQFADAWTAARKGKSAKELRDVLELKDTLKDLPLPLQSALDYAISKNWDAVDFIDGWTMFADTIGTAHRGSVGFGHSAAYYSKLHGVELFAHATPVKLIPEIGEFFKIMDPDIYKILIDFADEALK